MFVPIERCALQLQPSIQLRYSLKAMEEEIESILYIAREISGSYLISILSCATNHTTVVLQSTKFHPLAPTRVIAQLIGVILPVRYGKVDFVS